MKPLDFRKNFPIFDEKIQLASCSQSALHKDVKNATISYMDSWQNEGMDWSYWMEKCENAREAFAELINAEKDEVAIVSSVSHAFSSVVTSLEEKKSSDKNKIIVSETDFPCIGHVALSQSKENVLYTDDYNEVDDSTLLMTASHVSYYDGEIANIKKFVEIAKNNNSYTFIDAYQSIGQVEIDVKEMNIDFLAAGMQKYMLGTPGIAFLYIKKDIAEQLTPKITGWFGQANPFTFDGTVVDYAPGAIRFDSGTFPMINGFIAEESLNIVNNIGVPKIQSHLQNLSQYALDYALEKGLIVVSSHDVTKKGSTTSIKFDNANLLEDYLRENGIIVSARNDVIRIAPHYYNTVEDIKIAIDAILDFVDDNQ